MNKAVIGLAVALAIVVGVFLFLREGSQTTTPETPVDPASHAGPAVPPPETLPPVAPPAKTAPPVPSILAPVIKTPILSLTPSFRGRVVDSHGDPVIGAHVQADPATNAVMLVPTPADDSPHQTQSGANGEFFLGKLPRKTQFHLFVTHDEYVGARRTRLTPSTTPLEIVLQSGSVVTGVVVDPSGHGVEGARVVSGPSYAFSDAAGWRVSGGGGITIDDLYPETRSGEDGVFRLGGIGGSGFSVRAYHSDWSASDPTNLQRSIEGAVLTLGAPIVIEGTVVDGGGTPLVGAEVYVRNGPEFVGPVLSREGGVFRLTGVSAGTTYLIANAAGHMEHSTALPHAVHAGDTLRGIELRLERSAKLRGRVVNTEGIAIAGAAVTILIPGQTTSRFIGETRTDAEGRFTLPSIRPSEEPDLLHGVQVNHDDYYAHVVSDAYPLPPGSDVDAGDLVLTRATRVEGTVVTTAGDPIEGASVQLHRAGERPHHPLRPPESDYLGGLNEIFVKSGSTDDQGRFSLASAGEGEYQVTAWAPGFQRVPSDSFSVDADVRGIEMILPEEVAIRGVLLDQSDEPCADIRLTATDGPSRATATTGEDGTFSLTGLTPTEHRVTIQELGWTSEEEILRLTPGPREIVLRAFPPGSVEGQVVEARTGAPILDYSLLWSREGFRRGTSRVILDPMGLFFIDAQAVGVGFVEVSAPGYVTVNERVQVNAGEVTHITLRLEPASTLSATVIDSRGKPFEGASVRLSSSVGANPPQSQSVTTGFYGTFTCEGLSPGTYTLRIEHSEALPYEQHSIVLAQGGSRDLGRLVLSKGSRVAGRLTLASGGSPAWANVRIVKVASSGETAGWEKFGGYDASSMEYSIAGVPPGRYRLSIGYPAGEETRTHETEAFEITEEVSRTIDLLLPSG